MSDSVLRQDQKGVAAHALELFKNEGLAPDALKRVEAFFAKRRN